MREGKSYERLEQGESVGDHGIEHPQRMPNTLVREISIQAGELPARNVLLTHYFYVVPI
jgi:hypothetical protein